MSEYEQFSFKGWNDETVYGYVMKPYGFTAGAKFPVAFVIHGGPQASFAQRVELSLESAGLGRSRLRRRVHRLPRLTRLRPGVHRFHQQGLGRQAARGSAEGSRGGAGEIPVARRRTTRARRRLLRRLHDQLDRGQLAGPVQVPRESRRHLRPAHRCTTPPRSCGFPSGSTAARTTTTRSSYEKFNPANFVTKWRTPMLVIHSEQDFRVPLEQGHRHVHGATAARHREPAADVPGREPLGAEASEQRAVAPNGVRLAGDAI